MLVPPTFSFKPRDRDRILQALHIRSRSKEAPRVISSLERAVARYKSWEAFERRQLPHSKVREKLLQLHRQLDGLQKALRDLDIGTRRALAPFLVDARAPSSPLLSAEKPRELVRLDRQLGVLDRRLESAAALCEAYICFRLPSRRGPKVRSAPAAFADLAAAEIVSCLPGIKLTSTAGGAYEQVLDVCFEAAGGLATGDLHRLVLATVRNLRKADRAAGGKIAAP